MRGMNAETGRALEGADHLRQSIRDILRTPVGSRVMLRGYGSRLPALVDQPATPGLRAALVAATAEALDRWEPRYRLRRAAVDLSEPGRVRIDLEGEHVPEDGSPAAPLAATVEL